MNPNQLILPVEHATPEPEPMPPVSTITSEQEADIDKYMDHGMNYHQACAQAGIAAVSRTVAPEQSPKTEEPVVKNPQGRRTGHGPATTRNNRRSDGQVDRRTMSARERRIADSVPESQWYLR
jgi:hypothetical protein